MAVHLDKLFDRLQPSEILLRHPIQGEPGMFERLAASMAEDREIPVSWFMPEAGGRHKIYDRDYQMVAAADMVEAFFKPDAVMEGGTGHVIEAAINKMVPAYAWAVHRWNAIDRVGEWEP